MLNVKCICTYEPNTGRNGENAKTQIDKSEGTG